jgi:hypothetical protein
MKQQNKSMTITDILTEDEIKLAFTCQPAEEVECLERQKSDDKK